MNRPVGYAEVVAMFGDPAKFRRADGTLSPAWEAGYITRIELPRTMPYVGGGAVGRLAVHKKLAPIVADTMRAAASDDEIWAALSPYGGGYEPRLKRGSSQVSLHTFGIALDFNPDAYPLGSDARFPQDVLDLFAGFGWFYGGDFEGRKDPMHFQFAEGC